MKVADYCVGKCCECNTNNLKIVRVAWDSGKSLHCEKCWKYLDFIPKWGNDISEDSNGE